MNILGITGAIGWDGNISTAVKGFGEFWVHGSGATLIMNGELKNSMCEERFSRIKYDGNYPVLAIEKILDYNKLTKYDIDLVVYVGTCVTLNFELKLNGYIENKIKEYFPNCKVEYVYHHVAHTAATFYTSGFNEADILSFDGAGDQELLPDGNWLTPHLKFSQGRDLTLTEITTWYCNALPMHTGFGSWYGMQSWMAYQNKMNSKGKRLDLLHEGEMAPINRETYPGKVMGLAAFGDYKKITFPDLYILERERKRYLNIEWEDCFPELHNNPEWDSMSPEESQKFNPDDLAAWSQHQFEKYLLLLLSYIPKKTKSDNLCLGGGCALNILANSKIIEQGIYKNVHVNTAPSDDGLHFGAALYKAAEYEHKITLPDDIGYLGISYTDEDIETALC